MQPSKPVNANGIGQQYCVETTVGFQSDSHSKFLCPFECCSKNTLKREPLAVFDQISFHTLYIYIHTIRTYIREHIIWWEVHSYVLRKETIGTFVLYQSFDEPNGQYLLCVGHAVTFCS